MSDPDGFIDIERTDVTDKEWATDDDTVGVLAAAPDDWFEADLILDVPRLRRALLAFEEEYDSDRVRLGVTEISPKGEPPRVVVTLANGDKARRAVALPRCVKPGDDDDLLLTEGDE